MVVGRIWSSHRGWWGVVAALAVVALLATASVVVTRLSAQPGRQAAPVPTAPTGTPVTTGPDPTPSPTPAAPPGPPLTGPLTFLLVGVDTRVSVPGWEPHADAVLLLHLPAGLDRGYLFSLPRDLLVEIPAYPEAGYRGGRTKLTHAMSRGSRVPGRPKRPDTAQGYELLRRTVTDYTGLPIDAGAVLTFGGFDDLVDALGGVELYVDQRTPSLHRRPDGRHREPGAGGYVGPQMVYEKGRRHLTGWQAVDYARQRYLSGGDYTRQRHQQQLVRAMVTRIQEQGLARQPERVAQVVAALGETLVYVGGPRLVEVAWSLAGLRPDDLTLVGLPGSSVGRGGGYRGEQLTSTGRRFLTELREGRAEQWLAEYPKLRVTD